MHTDIGQFIYFNFFHNRPAVNQRVEFSQCPPHFLMMKTWPGLTPGPPQPGIASLKVPSLTLAHVECIHQRTHRQPLDSNTLKLTLSFSENFL